MIDWLMTHRPVSPLEQIVGFVITLALYAAARMAWAQWGPLNPDVTERRKQVENLQEPEHERDRHDGN